MPVSARMIRTGPTEGFGGKTLPERELQSEVLVLECFLTWLGRFLLIRWSRVRVPTASLHNPLIIKGLRRLEKPFSPPTPGDTPTNNTLTASSVGLTLLKNSGS